MKNKILKYSIGILLAFISCTIHAQQPIGDEEPTVKVIGMATKDAIKLRWGVNTPSSWKYAIQYGFTIERKTIVIDKQILKEPIVKKLVTFPMLPKPLEEWEQFVNQSDYAAIAAQAIYGDDFEVELEEGGSPLINIINQAQVLEQRFTFALYAADLDFKVAQFSGLSYVDKDVKANERYLYTVYSAVPQEKLNIKSGGVYLGLEDQRPLSKPQELIGVFNDKNVLLSWNYKLLKNEYNSYILERADNNSNDFKALDNIPIINLNEKEKESESSSRIFFTDSLPKNNTIYRYRVKGISAFGETGPPSDVVSGQGKSPMAFTPAINEARLQPDNQSAVITWEFPEKGYETLSHFELNRSNQIDTGYEVIRANIHKDTRSITIQKLGVINYFTISAIGVHGAKRVSFPKMVQPVDDTPPAIPLGLTGKIDSTGVVRLQWKSNIEPDFLGYRVFRANTKDEEFTQITFKPVPQNTITDTVSIKTLNTKVYYKVQAFDKRYNPSGFSQVFILKKPDHIPPTTPVFASFKTAEEGVMLKWEHSSSIDAVKTLVYRKEKGKDTPWELVAETQIPQDSFTDTGAVPLITYLYTLVTLDDSGLESPPAAPLTISLPDAAVKPAIGRFEATVNREEKKIVLNWKYNADHIAAYRLYKSEEDAIPTLYKICKASDKNFVDSALKVNTTYQYMLQAVFKSGAKSPIKKINVEY